MSPPSGKPSTGAKDHHAFVARHRSREREGEGGTMLEFVEITCPYCGESFETGVDASAGSTSYIEDCQVCCRPMEFRLRADTEGTLEVEVHRSDE
jgi:hypothetical protein